MAFLIAALSPHSSSVKTVFPSHERTREFQRRVGREADWRPVPAESGASYDLHDEIEVHD
jgi:hypothetical protein